MTIITLQPKQAGPRSTWYAKNASYLLPVFEEPWFPVPEWMRKEIEAYRAPRAWMEAALARVEKRALHELTTEQGLTLLDFLRHKAAAVPSVKDSRDHIQPDANAA